MMRIVLFSVLLCLTWVVIGQQPGITAITPTNIEFGETITITGSNLTGGSARVFFGSIESTSVTVSGENLIAEVPGGTINGPVTVLNNGLIAQSSESFFIAFGGSGTPSFAAPDTIDIAGSEARNVFDICLCDINTDGLNDVVITHENFSNSETDLAEYTYFLNTTTDSANPSFATPVTINLDGTFANIDGFVSVECADLDNNGDFEFIFISSERLASPIFIFDDLTSGTSSFQLEIPRAVSGDTRDPRGLAMSDINNDGLLDVIVGNGTDNSLHIFRNRGGLTFDDAIEFTLENGTETESFAVGDLNNDLLPDIAIIPFGSPNSEIYLLKNNSFTDEISFVNQNPITDPGKRRSISIGDFNNDGFADIATTTNIDRNSEEVEIFENTSADKGRSFLLTCSRYRYTCRHRHYLGFGLRRFKR